MAICQLTASTLSAYKMDSSLDNRLYSTKMSSVYTPMVNTESKRNFLSIFVSYNCRGFNFVKSGFINSLLLECDILFIQELINC